MFTRKVQLEEDILLIISWLWMMPLLSLPELAAVSGLPYHRCRTRILRMYDKGLVSKVSLGMTIDSVDRWFLTTSGANDAVTPQGYAIEWQVSEWGLKFLVQRLPMLESFYQLELGLWGLDEKRRTAPIYRTADPDEQPLTFPHDLALRRCQRQRNADIYAITEYENWAWVPWVGVGPMTTGRVLRNKSARGQAMIGTDPHSGNHLSPAAVVLVGADLLAGVIASRQWKGDHMMALTSKGHLLRSMQPQEFTQAYREDATTDDLGAPENIPDWVKHDPIVSALNGKSTFGLFDFVAQWPGGSIGQLQQRFGDSHRHTSERLQNLAEPGLLTQLDGSWYLGRPGMLAAARMDRISHQSIYSSFDVYLKADGANRRRQQKHDRAVLEFILAYSLGVDEAWHGRRAVLNLADRTQVAPDAWVTFPRSDRPRQHWRVEVELAARHPSTARRKLGPYRRILQHTGTNIRLQMVLGTEAAEKVFLQEGRGLNMCTTTLNRLRSSGDNILRSP